tara:strand:+ start:1195 stop:1662 length:468 start_codon:yes stop_codon:yes gene_type:complete
MSGIINSAGSRSGVIGTTEIDYEEGTTGTGDANGILTPISGTSITCDTHFTIAYAKIGNTIFITGQLFVSGVASPSGIKLNLPFVCKSGNRGYRSGSGMVTYGSDFGTGATSIGCMTTEGSSFAHIRGNVDNGGYIDPVIEAGDYYTFSFNYITE